MDTKKIKRIIAREGLIVVFIIGCGLILYAITKSHIRVGWWHYEYLVRQLRYLTQNVFYLSHGIGIKNPELCIKTLIYVFYYLGYPIYALIRFILWANRKLKGREMKKTLTLLILSICVLALLLKLNPSFRKAPTLKGIPYYEADTNQAQEVQPEVTQPKQVQVETIQPAQSLMGMACDFDNNQANDRGAMCEKCNRLFCVERNQIPDYKETTCPYCGQTQTLEFALNRGTYYLKQVIAQLQAQQQANQAAGLNNVIRGLKESSQRQSDYIQESIKNMPKFGGHHKSTTCRQGLGGTIECDTTER